MLFFCSIDLTEEGISTSFNSTHSEKANPPIEVTK